MKFDSSNLASGMVPYAVKHIEVQPFRPRHMPYLSEAICTNNLAPLIEAVGQVISEFDVKQLTQGDFFCIVTWLRFASRDLPLFAEWDCEGTLFRRKDNGQLLTMAKIDEMVDQWEAAKGTEAEAHMENPRDLELEEVDCDQYNKQDIEHKDFNMKMMDPTPLAEGLDYPRVRHLVEYLELSQDNRYKIVIGPICYLNDDSGKTLAERLQRLEKDQISMELFDRASAAYFKHEHGMLERIYKPCVKCGSLHPFEAMIDARSFFM